MLTFLDELDPKRFGLPALDSQLKLLGFTLGCQIWIKTSWDLDIKYLPDFWPKKKSDQSPKQQIYQGLVCSSGLEIALCRWAGLDEHQASIWKATEQIFDHRHLQKLADLGATINFYPTQPQNGISNRNVDHSVVIFYEIDDTSLASQRRSLQDFALLTGLYPCAVVFSGKKSLHIYYRLSSPVEASIHWRRLTRKLCIAQNSDYKIPNPARAMRLAGVSRLISADCCLIRSAVCLEAVSSAEYSPEAFELALDSLGLFPYNLSDERWREWVRLKGLQKTGQDVDLLAVLLEPGLEERIRQEHLRVVSMIHDPHSPETDRWVGDALQTIPQRQPGSNTYEIYRKVLIALRDYYGEEKAIAIMERHSPSASSGWNVRQVCRSSSAHYGLGTLFWVAKQFGWQRPRF